MEPKEIKMSPKEQYGTHRNPKEPTYILQKLKIAATSISTKGQEKVCILKKTQN